MSRTNEEDDKANYEEETSTCLLTNGCLDPQCSAFVSTSCSKQKMYPKTIYLPNDFDTVVPE